ncbi:MAG: FecR domain-containing protein [Rikenellaceae bacterium]|nr:FecR domain-containing protein [Rikenellaceae bacterium]
MNDKNHLIHDLLTDGMKEPERSELLCKIMGDKKLADEYVSFKNTLATASLRGVTGDVAEGKRYYALFKRKMLGRRVRRTALRIGGAAASLALIFSLSWIYSSQNTYRSLEALTTVFEVPAGQRAVITLSDGTSVQLNARSVLEYPSVFSKDSREVILRGEGFFDVARDGRRPFRVRTSDMDVKVLGTQFDVMAYEGRSHQVSVLEGTVEVAVKDGTEKMILLPGNTVTCAEGRLKMTLFENDDNFMWTRGLYAFVSTDFATIIEKLSFYYDVTIELRNRDLAGIIYTGKFRQTDGAMEILKVIQNIHGFSLHKQADGTIVIE